MLAEMWKDEERERKEEEADSDVEQGENEQHDENCAENSLNRADFYRSCHWQACKWDYICEEC